MKHVTKVQAFALVAGLLIQGGSIASAQTFTDRTPVAVIVLPSVREGQADALVIRRKDVKPHDVIAVKKSKLTEALLVAAVRQVQIARQIGGLTPTEDVMFRVQLPKDGRKRAQENDATLWIRDLKDAAEKTIAGVGTGNVIVIYLKNNDLTATKK